MIEITELQKVLTRIQQNLLEAKLAIDKFTCENQDRLVEIGNDLKEIKKELSQ